MAEASSGGASVRRALLLVLVLAALALAGVEVADLPVFVPLVLLFVAVGGIGGVIYWYTRGPGVPDPPEPPE